MKAQFDLFSINIPRPDPADTTARARKSDPQTSADAAKSIEPTQLEAQVLAALKSFGPDGATTHEIGAALHLPRDSVSPRMVNLIEKKKAVQTSRRRPGPSGRNCIVFQAT